MRPLTLLRLKMQEQQLNNFLKDSENPKSNNVDIGDLPEKVRCIVSEEFSKFTETFNTMTEEKTNMDKRSDNRNGDREKEVCCTELLGGTGSCNYKDRRRFSHNIDFKKRGVCRFDLKNPGSCRYGRTCFWSHQTPTNLRNDKKFVNQFLNTQYESLSNKINNLYFKERFRIQRSILLITGELIKAEKKFLITQEGIFKTTPKRNSRMS